MSQKYTLPVGILIGILLVPAVVGAQQRGSAAPVPMAAPARSMPVAAAPAMLRAPVRPTATAAPAHPSGHGFVPSAHPSAPRIPGHTSTPRTPVHSRPVQSNPNHGNGHYFAPSRSPEDDNGVPGLGFDYPHYAATHPNAGHHEVHSGSVTPFIGGGMYIPSLGYMEAEAPAETVGGEGRAETEAEVSETTERPEPAPVEQAPVLPATHSRSTPLAPAAEYIFVRRDGTVFFAVAYSWVNGNLQYITHDGFRKLASTSTLDMDATAQFNEQRGVAFHSPV